jgi:hypothetical protein
LNLKTENRKEDKKKGEDSLALQPTPQPAHIPILYFFIPLAAHDITHYIIMQILYVVHELASIPVVVL